MSFYVVLAIFLLVMIWGALSPEPPPDSEPPPNMQTEKDEIE